MPRGKKNFLMPATFYNIMCIVVVKLLELYIIKQSQLSLIISNFISIIKGVEQFQKYITIVEMGITGVSISRRECVYYAIISI